MGLGIGGLRCGTLRLALCMIVLEFIGKARLWPTVFGGVELGWRGDGVRFHAAESAVSSAEDPGGGWAVSIFADFGARKPATPTCRKIRSRLVWMMPAVIRPFCRHGAGRARPPRRVGSV